MHAEAPIYVQASMSRRDYWLHLTRKSSRKLFIQRFEITDAFNKEQNKNNILYGGT